MHMTELINNGPLLTANSVANLLTMPLAADFNKQNTFNIYSVERSGIWR